MENDHPPGGQEELEKWIRQKLDQAVKELMERKIVDVLLAEAKPAWVFPFQILIGKVRERGQRVGHIWLICGERIPTDHVRSFKAPSPREAARHFALKWQLEAARAQEVYEKSGGRWMPGARSGHGKDELVKQAEGLLDLVTVDHLWE